MGVSTLLFESLRFLVAPTIFGGGAIDIIVVEFLRPAFIISYLQFEPIFSTNYLLLFALSPEPRLDAC